MLLGLVSKHYYRMSISDGTVREIEVNTPNPQTRGCLKTIFQNRSWQPLVLAHTKEKRPIIPQKQYTKPEGQSLPLKKGTVFLFYGIVPGRASAETVAASDYIQPADQISDVKPDADGQTTVPEQPETDGAIRYPRFTEMERF